MIQRVASIVSSALVALTVVVALSLAAARIFGAGAYVVLSGSMEPSYHVGSLLYDERVKPEDLKEGDPITFSVARGTVVTHRIVGVSRDDAGALQFATKGDANNSPDAGMVDERNVIGRPVISVPLLGYAVYYVSRPPGIFVAALVAAALLLASMITSRKNP